MNKKFVTAACAALLTGSFFAVSFVSASAAAEKYDVRAYGPKSQIVWNKPVKAVFDHRTHTEGLGLECNSCHDEIFAMQRGVAPRTGKFNMATMAEGKFCGSCHDGQTAFATDTNCSACHTIPEDPIVWTKPVKAVVFSHEAHTNDYGLECDSCHNDAFTMKVGTAEKSANFTMKALYDGQYCGKCHDGETAFASNTLCNTCHIGTKGYKRMTGVDQHAEKHGGH
ncbi:MAG TPA: hypothetical protein EYP35_02050 [Desulfobacterales bacterium]|nr:hypothetical protein [Desulfobacterales bacterium]HIP40667.1 hypothetical protein [Desulfocapsa sulfexigens]